MPALPKDITNKFYSFDIPFDQKIPADLLTKISGFKISQTDDVNHIAFGLSLIQLKEVTPGDTKPTFYLQLIKGDFGKVDYLVGKTLFKQTIDSVSTSVDTLGSLSNRKPDDIKVQTFYSVMQLGLISKDGKQSLKGIISHPTIKGSLLKGEIEIILKEFLTSVFGVPSDKLIDFGVSETYSTQKLETIADTIPQKITFSQKQQVNAFGEFFGFGKNSSIEEAVDGISEQDIEFTISVSKKSSGLFRKAFSLKSTEDKPVQRVTILTKQGRQIGDSFYYKNTIPVELLDGHLLGDQKNFFLIEASKSVQHIFSTLFPI